MSLRPWLLAPLSLALACSDPQRTIVDAAIVDGVVDDGRAPGDAGGDGAIVDGAIVDGAIVDAMADGSALDGSALDAADCPIGLDDTIPAVLAITTDDNTKVWLNGVLIDAAPRLWSNPQRYDVQLLAHPARTNVLAIEGVNLQNQAGYDRGLVADLRFTANGVPQVIATDPATRATNTLTAGWEQPGFDDRAWPPAVALGAVGIAPWGAVFATIAPGSTAQWIWTYDPSAVTDKPTVESTYARRSFAVVDDRCPVVGPPLPSRRAVRAAR